MLCNLWILFRPNLFCISEPLFLKGFSLFFIFFFLSPLTCIFFSHSLTLAHVLLFFVCQGCEIFIKMFSTVILECYHTTYWTPNMKQWTTEVTDRKKWNASVISCKKKSVWPVILAVRVMTFWQLCSLVVYKVLNNKMCTTMPAGRIV